MSLDLRDLLGLLEAAHQAGIPVTAIQDLLECPVYLAHLAQWDLPDHQDSPATTNPTSGATCRTQSSEAFQAHRVRRAPRAPPVPSRD